MTASRTSSAPKLNAVPERQYPRPSRHRSSDLPYLVPDRRQSPARRRKAEKAAGVRAVKIFVIALCMMGMLCALICERAKLIELNSKRAVAEQQLQELRSDKVRLDAQFSSLVSVENVEEYAQKELGMVKRQNYQIHFFPNDKEDEIVRIDVGQ